MVESCPCYLTGHQWFICIRLSVSYLTGSSSGGNQLERRPGLEARRGRFNTTSSSFPTNLASSLMRQIPGSGAEPQLLQEIYPRITLKTRYFLPQFARTASHVRSEHSGSRDRNSVGLLSGKLFLIVV